MKEFNELVSNLDSVGFYIHFPFCARRCPYCDFSVVVSKPAQFYLDALIKELSMYSNYKFTVETVYYGGGTPSYASEFLHTVTKFIFDNFNLKEGFEFSIEANPEDFSICEFRDFISFYKPRVSLGVQSMDPKILKFLGRGHNPKDVFYALEFLKSIGIENINADFIFGLGKYKRNVKTELSSILDYLTHVSTYMLTVEPSTYFYERGFKPKINEIEYRQVIDILNERGFKHYEISNFAKVGYESHHNKRYWEHKPVLGIGLGAVSFFINSNFGYRIFNLKNYKDYISSENKIGFFEKLSPITLTKERLIFDIRTFKPIQLEEKYWNILEKKYTSNVLENSNGGIKLTDYGVLYSNEVIRDVLYLLLALAPTSSAFDEIMMSSFS